MRSDAPGEVAREFAQQKEERMRAELKAADWHETPRLRP